MAASLENLLRESGSTFTKQFHVPCMAHVLKRAIQEGLKELGNSSLTSLCSEIEGDEEYEEDNDRYYVAYKPITLSCILFMFIEMKFIHFHSCVMFAMKSMSMCND